MGYRGGDDSPQSTTTKTTNVPAWVERESENLYNAYKATTGHGRQQGTRANQTGPASQVQYPQGGLTSQFSTPQNQNNMNRFGHPIQQQFGSGGGAFGQQRFGQQQQTPAYEQPQGISPQERVYQGPRVAPIHPAQHAAQSQAYQTNQAFQPELNDVSRMLKQQYERAPERVGTQNNAQKIQFNRFTGAESDPLFNAYYEKMYKPASAELNRELQRAATLQNRTNALSGGRGGSGQIHAQALAEEGRIRALQNLGKDIFGQAMGAFQTEEGRNLEAQKAQAGIYESDLERKLKADLVNQAATQADKQVNIHTATGLMNNILSKYHMNAQDITRLFNIGAAGQKQNQAEINSAMQKWDEMTNMDRNEIVQLFKLMAANPGGTTTATQTATGGPTVSPAENLGYSALQFAPGIYQAYKS